MKLFLSMAGFLAALCLFSAVPADELQPGDFGYRHAEFHHAYQQITEVGPGDKGFRSGEMTPHYRKVFTTGKCHCATGECRPTVYRTSAFVASGIEVLIDRKWCAVPESALLKETEVPEELLVDPAHVCAGTGRAPNGCPLVIECARVNANG